jgi:uncharacterized protein (DUF433 family)
MERQNITDITTGRPAPPAHWPTDPSVLPIYSIAEVARSLRMSESVLADWTRPQSEYGKRSETFAPLIQVPDLDIGQGRLSFYNAVEAHVLLAIRKAHKIPMLEVRRVLNHVREKLPSKHPLVDYDFATKGKHLFIQQITATVDLSAGDQVIIHEILDRYLKRIHRTQSGVAMRLIPIAPGTTGETQPVMMDMDFSSGRLVVFDTGVLVAVIHGRAKAGHTLERLARDYRLTPEQIKGAIDYLEAKPAA